MARNEPRKMGEFPRNLKEAARLQCRICNDTHGVWDSSNDCTGYSCWMYPFRPGTGGPDRLVRAKSEKRVASGKRLANLARMGVANNAKSLHGGANTPSSKGKTEKRAKGAVAS